MDLHPVSGSNPPLRRYSASPSTDPRREVTMPSSLSTKTVLLIGASRGLGLAMVAEFLL